jgi:hypothetical protein
MEEWHHGAGMQENRQVPTLLQKQNSFPSMDGNGAPESVNFVDVG